MGYHKIKRKTRKLSFREYIKRQKIHLINKSDYEHVKKLYTKEKGKLGKPFKQKGEWYVYFHWKQFISFY